MEHEWFELGRPSVDVSERVLHVLPCYIDHNGPADTSKLAASQSSGSWKATFRGRPLSGRQVDLTQLGYTGIHIEPQATNWNSWESQDTLQDSADSPDPRETGETRYQPRGEFSKVVVWEHGDLLGSADPWATKLPELLEVANKIHR